MTIFSGPRGLTVLSFVLFAGCGGGGNTPAEAPRDASVSVSVTSRHSIQNVRKLVLNVTPVYLHKGDASSVRLLSDESGQNMVVDNSLPRRTLTVIDTLKDNPLGPVTIASNIPIAPASQGKQSYVRFYAWSLNVMDSYVEIDDGRFCAVNLILPGDYNPNTEGDQYITYNLNDMTIGGGDRWRINLVIDPEMETFNPAGCAGTTDLRIRAGDVMVERL